MGLTGVPIPYGAPNAQAHVERFTGSLRRECLDHFIFLSEDHLRRVVCEYVRYYNDAWPHQGIGAIPLGVESSVGPPDEGAKLVARPILGGLHHDYSLAA